MRDRAKNLPGKCTVARGVGDAQSGIAERFANDALVMSWWRIVPAHALGPDSRRRIGEVLDRVFATDALRQSALNGDPASAVFAALQLRDDKAVTVRTDLMMTALLRCALEGSAGAALVMSHLLRRLPLGGRRGSRLGASWIVRNLSKTSSPPPQRRHTGGTAAKSASPRASDNSQRASRRGSS